jgi:hypothetical protein
LTPGSLEAARGLGLASVFADLSLATAVPDSVTKSLSYDLLGKMWKAGENNEKNRTAMRDSSREKVQRLTKSLREGKGQSLLLLAPDSSPLALGLTVYR